MTRRSIESINNRIFKEALKNGPTQIVGKVESHTVGHGFTLTEFVERFVIARASAGVSSRNAIQEAREAWIQIGEFLRAEDEAGKAEAEKEPDTEIAQ